MKNKIKKSIARFHHIQTDMRFHYRYIQIARITRKSDAGNFGYTRDVMRN